MSECVSDPVQEATMRKIQEAAALEDKRQKLNDHMKGVLTRSEKTLQDIRNRKQFEEEEKDL